MSKIIDHLKANVILWLLIPLALIAPDFIAQIFNDNNNATLHGKFLLGLCAFGLFLSFSPRIVAFLILGFFVFLEFIQFGHLFYYNSLITATKFQLLFDEVDEVFETAAEAIKFLYLVPFIVLIPYGLLIFSFNQLEKKRFKTKWMTIPVLVVLAIIPYRVNYAYNGVNYYPDPADHSLRNSLYAYSNYILNLNFPALRAENNYEEYKIEPIAYQANANIILIIGESLNPRHMSLFDYQRNTNPLLSTLKTDPNFIYAKALSAGVNTMVSVPLLLNGIYEPNNYQALEKVPVNLFKLAKQHNFKTFYISAQSGALLTNVGAEFIDYALFRKKAPLLFEQYQDEALLKIIPDLEYAHNNFIVIHQRNIHAPYEGNYEHNPKFQYFSVNNDNYQQFLVDTYDNAVRFNDYITYELINFYRHKFAGPTYILFTPDHGEGVGYNNVYGHSNLHEEIYNVPFIAYLLNPDLHIKQQIQKKTTVCHYQIHNLIAAILGFKINNPNEVPGTCYVQGTNLYGLNEFIIKTVP